MKDLGITIDSALSFDDHIQNIVSKANRMAGLIRRSFVFLDEDVFKRLFKAFVRPHLDGHAVWNPYKSKHVDALEMCREKQLDVSPLWRGYPMLTG